MNRVIPVLGAALAIFTAACSSGSSDSGREAVLAVSIAPQATLLKDIAGDDFEIVTLLPRGADPESFDPTPGTRRSVADADAFFITGAFPFERTVAASLPDSIPVVDGSREVELIYGTHGCDDYGHSHADPHIWTSVRNMRAMAAGMATRLAALRPHRAAVYSARLDSLTEVFDSLDAEIAAVIAESSSKAFAVRHPSLSYFARDYGLRQHALGMEGKEMSTRGLRAVIDAARADSVRVFFVDASDQQARTATIADEIGARTVVINLLEPDWQSQLKAVANAISGT